MRRYAVSAETSTRLGAIPRMTESEQLDSPGTTPKRVAVMMAHPDDPDFSCAGTCAKWAAEGHHITYVLITNGDKGSDDRSIPSDQLVEIREVEQHAAATILGVQECVFMRWA